MTSLSDERPGQAAAGDIPTNWVVVATHGTDTDAEAKRLLLEAEGIPTILKNEHMGSASMFQIATEGIRIRVPQEHLADARAACARSHHSGERRRGRLGGTGP